MAAMFSPSWNAPLFTAPSPKNATLDLVGLQQLEAVAGAGRLQDARADDAAGAHQPDLGREEVHAAAAAVRAAGRPAEQLGDQLARRHALGQRVAVPAVGAEDDVVGPQMGADADGDRLLPDVGVAGAVDRARAWARASCSSTRRMRSISRKSQSACSVVRSSPPSVETDIYEIPHAKVERISGPLSVTSTIFSERAPNLPSSP